MDYDLGYGYSTYLRTEIEMDTYRATEVQYRSVSVPLPKACPGAMGIFLNSDMDPDFVRSGFRIGGDQSQFFYFVTTYLILVGTVQIQSAVQVLSRCDFFACLIGCYRSINISFASESADP